MKKPNIKLLNTILAFGMLLLLAGILVVLGFAGGSQTTLWCILSIVVSLTGLAFLYIFFVFSKTSFKFFVGLEFLLNGLFLFCLSRGLFPLGLKELWPCMILLTSVSLFSASRIKGHHFNLSYDFTAISLLFLGLFFLLFSLEIIKHSFKDVILYLMPVSLILSGAFLIILFVQRKTLMKIISEDNDGQFDSDDDFDEETSGDL